jgi:hypothetical protein
MNSGAPQELGFGQQEKIQTLELLESLVCGDELVSPGFRKGAEISVHP